MKKILLLALLTVGAEAAQAQSISAGTVSLGGGIGYSRSSNKYSFTQGNTTTTQETTSSQFSFSPSAGYFIVDNLAIGINLSYTAIRKPYVTYTPSPGVVRAELDPTTNLRLGVYGQYYKMITEQFGVLGTLGIGFQSNRDYDYSGSGTVPTIVETKGSGYYAGLTPGIIFFPIPKLGVSASIGSLGYEHISYDAPSGVTNPSNLENTSSSFGASFGLSQLVFGGTYYFGR